MRQSPEKERSHILSTRIFIPPETTIKADNEKTAQAKLKKNHTTMTPGPIRTLTINVSVQIGEIRILKKIRDKGNDFELEITYQYYRWMS